MTDEKVFTQLEVLAKGIRNELRKKGFVIPCDNGDGTITIENYTIVKDSSGFYSIKDRWNEVIVDKINLPQTAALLANGLALGRYLDNDIIREDQRYGFGLFEETAAKQNALKNLKKKDLDRAVLLFTKSKIAKSKKLNAKAAIQMSFDKLRRLR